MTPQLLLLLMMMMMMTVWPAWSPVD